MIKFKNLKTGEIKTAFSLREEGEKTYVKFSKDGKEYGYFKSNVEIISPDSDNLPFRVYIYKKECYKCHKPTEILTYITYADKPAEDVTFPYDYGRLLKHQNIVAHLQDPSIEYYGLNVIGDIKEFDHMLMEKYPERIKNTYSKTKNESYPMNVCSHCGSGQGWYFIYRDINKFIQNKEEIQVFDK